MIRIHDGGVLYTGFQSEDTFWTAFPLVDDEHEMPQDFPTKAEAEEYVRVRWGGQGFVETPF